MLIKSGAGLPTMATNGAAWTALGAAHHGSGTASAINTAMTSAGWIGAGSAGSALDATMLNVALHGLAGWVDVKGPIVAAAAEAYQLACGSMRTFQECEENRIETATDYGINPSVLGALTPRIASLEYEYYGLFWPNNAAVGASYGATLTALASSLTVPAPVSGMGASPAAPAAAADAVGEATARTAAGGAMRAAYGGTATAGNSAGRGASAAGGMGGQMSSLLGPVQQAGSSLAQAPQQLAQTGQGTLGPAQSMLGMFMSPNMFGGPLPPAATGSAPSPMPPTGAAAVPGMASGAGGGGPGLPPSAFTRPVSAFESGGGRPVGLRPAGALGSVESPRVNAAAAGPMGGMPIGRAAGAPEKVGRHDRPGGRATTARVVDGLV